MVSQTLTTKQLFALLGKTQAVSETSPEYPSLQKSSPPRHLCTSTTTSAQPVPNNKNKLLNTITSEHYTIDSNKYAKNSKEQTEIIDLFSSKQIDDLQNKLYKKTRYQSTKQNDCKDFYFSKK